MLGAAIMVIMLVVVIPVGFLVAMAGVAAGLGFIVKSEIDATYEGTEYFELGR